MKKILVDKKDGAAAVVQQIRSEPESEITLVIPRDAALKESVHNFHLLEREAAASGKKLAIESVDETILALAEAARLEAAHPFFHGGVRRLSDIVPSPRSKPREPQAFSREETEAEPEAEPEPEPEPVRAPAFEETSEEEPEWREPSFAAGAGGRPRSFFLGRRGIVFVLIVVLGIGAAWYSSAAFGRANIVINFRKTPWQFEGGVVASRAATKVDPARRVIPGEVFRDQRNITQLFPASGKATVAQKAAGRVTIYNAHSSQSQTLVATTRFATPEGLIFRLDEQVVVPGAAIKDGKVVPASIQAGVTADKAGPVYNLGRVERLSIPGLKGTPKYNDFYGVLEEGTKGGFIGERAVPTEADIAAAKDKTAETLKAALQSSFLSKRPESFNILGASQTTVTRLSVNKNTDDNGSFSVFGEAQFRAVGFRESDLRSLLELIVGGEHAQMIFKDLKVEYRDPSPNFDRGEVSFKVVAEGALIPDFSVDGFKTEIAGRPLRETRSVVAAVPMLADANVSLWPFWLGRIPRDLQRIMVVVN